MSGLAISTVIPTYNRARLLPRALDSVLRQSLPDDEAIVVDDGSTDDTQAVLERYRDRIRYIRIDNSGAGAARNHGIRAATRALVAFQDSDDEWLEGKVALQRAFMEAQPDVLFCFGDFRLQDAHGVETPRYLANWHDDGRSWDEILGPGVPYRSLVPGFEGEAEFKVHVGDLYLRLLYRPHVPAWTMMIRREAAGEALRFAEGRYWEDWECSARLAGKGKAAYFDCELVRQHVHGGPRFSEVDLLHKATARIAMTESVWGRDPAFLHDHGDEYARVLREQRLARVVRLLMEGQPQEARAELRRVSGAPLQHRLLTRLPGGLARGLLNLRRWARGAAS